jgi:putative transposase
MTEAGLEGVSRRKRRGTTKRNDEAPPAPDLVERDFGAPTGPDQLWVADLTYIPTWAGFLYLAVVIDAWSRRVVGWSMTNHLRTELVLDALNMALWQRRPEAVIHHSDQGTHDNALCESFFATLEWELLDQRRFSNQAEAKMAVFDFIEGFYNPRRRHSSLGHQSPVNFEKMRAAAA